MQPLVAKRKNDACGGEYFPRIGGRNSLFLQDRREEYSASPRCPGPFAGGSRRLPLGNLSGNDHSHFWLIVPVPAGLLSWVSGNHAEFAPDSGRCRRRIDPFQTFSSTGTAAVHLQARDMEVGNPHSANLRCAMSAPTAARGYRISALSGTNPSDVGFPTATRRSTPYTSGKIPRNARIPIRQLRRRRWSARWSRRAAPAELGVAAVEPGTPSERGQ